MATFTLTIKLGNDAMQTGEDIAGALYDASFQLASVGDTSPEGRSRAIHDYNGNTVGEWKVTR